MNKILSTLLKQARSGTLPPFTAWRDALGDDLPWLYSLEETPQDSEWHGEGDVAAHTTLVLLELDALFKGEAAHLTADEREIITLAALLHDIGKVKTTREEGGRIISPHHTGTGCNYLAYRLPETGLPYPLIREVMALVRYHHHPRRLVIDDAPPRAYWRLARQVNLEWVYWLERADGQGRTALDKTSMDESLELFRLLAEEAGVWQNPDPYAEWRTVIDTELATYPPHTRAFVLEHAIEDFESGKIFTPEEAIAISHQYRNNYGEVVLTVAPSGAGKSTWIAEHLPDHEVISLDEMRGYMTGKRTDQSRNSAVVQRAREELKKLLRQKQRVVWDATSLRRVHRDRLLQIGREYSAKTKVVVFHLPASLAQQRNSEREHPIPDDIMQAQINGIEWVEVTEAHEVVYVDEY
jgi:putative nucleotidyltransferase with HDIG domain